MRMKVRSGCAVLLSTLGTLGLAAALWGQAQHPGPLTNLSGRNLANGQESTEDSNLSWHQQRIRALNAERQKSIVSDTAKLLKLARQLDAEIASNSAKELSPEELRKVAEIEKLARSVKEKMARSVDDSPTLRSPAVQLNLP